MTDLTATDPGNIRYQVALLSEMQGLLAQKI